MVELRRIEVKEIDDQGRVVIPKEWRKRNLTGRKLVLKLKDGAIEIVPYESLDLTQYFDRAQAKVKSDLSDWHGLKKELGRR